MTNCSHRHHQPVQPGSGILRRARLHAIAAACLAAGSAGGAWAQDNEWILRPLPSRYNYEVQIKSVQDGPLLENQPIQVTYSIDVRGFHLLGPLPAAREGLICDDAMKNCKSVGLLTEGRHLTGKIATTTTAGARAPLRIVLASPSVCAPGVECFGVEPLNDATVTRPVAARYSVWLDTFEIQHTRARHNDTLWTTLRGMVDGQRSAADDACSIFQQTTCATAGLGDFNNGLGGSKTWPIPNFHVGTFDVIPEIDGDLRVGFTLINAGHTDNETGFIKTLQTINAATGAAMQAAYGSQFAALQAFTGQLNEMFDPDCDGPTFVGLKVFLNKDISASAANTLDSVTRNTGRVDIAEPVQTIPSQNFCGSSSKYRVFWSVRRDSWIAH